MGAGGMSSAYVWCDNLDHPGDSHLYAGACVTPTGYPVPESIPVVS